MSVEIKKVYKEHIPAVRFIGKRQRLVLVVWTIQWWQNVKKGWKRECDFGLWNVY